MLTGGPTEPGSGPSHFSAAQLRKLGDIARTVGRPLPSEFTSSCESFLRELAKWNRRINLISPRDRKRIVERHVLDSLCLLAFDSRLAGKRILDVGSGAGFPGMVLAMWETKAHVTLVESKSKPVAFLRTVRRSLGLDNVEVVHARLESVAEPGRISPVDIVTSRAVGGTLRLAEVVAPILNPGGAIVVYTARCPRAGKAMARSAKMRGRGPIRLPVGGANAGNKSAASGHRHTGDIGGCGAARGGVASDDASAMERLGLGLEFLTPAWQSLTILLILRRLG